VSFASSFGAARARWQTFQPPDKPLTLTHGPQVTRALSQSTTTPLRHHRPARSIEIDCRD
jgi:hypothetical protein